MSAAFQVFHLPRSTAISSNLTLIAGARVRFFLTTTVTPTPVYQDSGLITPHTQPVEADSAGRLPPIYLDPSIVYRVTFTDGANVEIYPAVDPVNDQALSASAIIAVLTASASQQSALNDLLQAESDATKRTVAEIALSITVVNYAYVPGEVDRYVINTEPGVTNTLTGWNAAAKLAKNTGCDLVFGRTWPYLVTGPIDLTCDAGADDFGFTVRNIGQAAAHTTNSPGYPSILANHTGHIFDCSGAPAINWVGVTAGTLTAGSTPKTCWFMARNSASSSQIHRFDKCRFIGKCSKAVIYNYGSENDSYDECVFYNYATDAGSRVGIWTAANVLSLSSTFITIATGTKPTTAHYINGGVWIHGAGGATSDVWYLEGATSFNIDSPFTLCTDGVATRGRSLLYIDTTNGPTNLVHLKGIQSEYGSFTCQYGIYIGDAVATVAEWTIEGCNLSANTSKIAAHANVVLDSFHMRGINSSGGTGNISIPGTLQNSDIMEYSTNITIANSTRNNLFVSIPNLTVTTRDGDNWLGPDDSLTWTPNTGALTITGALTVSNKTVHYNGREVTVTVTLQAATSIVCAAGTAITGLPRAVAVGNGVVHIRNITDTTAIAGGHVSGTSIKLPAINETTDELAISVTYFVAA